MTLSDPTIHIREVRAGSGRRTRFTVRLRDGARTRERLPKSFARFTGALWEATLHYGARLPVVQIDADGRELPWPGPTNPPSKNPEGGRLLRERLVCGPVTPLPPDVAVALKDRLFPCPLDDYRDPNWSRSDLACYCLPPRVLALDVIDFDAFNLYCLRCRRWFDWAALRGVMETLRRME